MGALRLSWLCVCVCVFMWVCALVYVEARCQRVCVCVHVGMCTRVCGSQKSICVCADVYIHVGMCTRVWRPEVNVGCLSLLLSTFFLKRAAFCELGAQQMG